MFALEDNRDLFSACVLQRLFPMLMELLPIALGKKKKKELSPPRRMMFSASELVILFELITGHPVVIIATKDHKAFT